MLLRVLDRLLDGPVVRALHEVDQGRGAAVQGRPADLRRRIRVDVGPARHFPLGLAMDVRVDAAGNDQAVLRPTRVRTASGNVPGPPTSTMRPSFTPISAAWVPVAARRCRQEPRPQI